MKFIYKSKGNRAASLSYMRETLNTVSNVWSIYKYPTETKPSSDCTKFYPLDWFWVGLFWTASKS